MYKSLTKTDFQKMLNLPDNYQIDGVLSSGHYDFDKQIIRLEKSLLTSNVEYKLTRLTRYLQNVIEIKINNKIYWFTVVYGGVTLSEYLHLACTFGSKKNIHIGSCGGLHPEMESLDFLIPTKSYGNESSTRFYAKDNLNNIHYPDKDLNEKIKSKIIDIKVWQGPVMTCSAMLGETKEDVKNWSKDGYYGVEMETSTVFSVSNHFSVPSASIVYVTDNLIKGQVIGDDSHKEQTEMRYQNAQKMYDIAVDILIND